MPVEKDLALTVVVGIGYVGRRLLDALPLDEALGLSRSGGGADSRIQHLDLDASTSSSLDVGDDAAIVYTVPPAPTADADDRLQRFLERLSSPPRRFIYLSTTGVYGDRRGNLVNEDDSVQPESTRALRRAAAERDLRHYCEKTTTELLVFRVPGIYGAGRLGVERIRDGAPVLAENETNPGNRIHVDDLVSCCLAALRTGVPAGIYNVGDGDERSSTWFANEVSRQLGLDPPPTIDRQTAEKTFSPMRLSFLRESRRLDLTKMHALLGVMPKYADAADGIAASIKEENV